MKLLFVLLVMLARPIYTQDDADSAYAALYAQYYGYTVDDEFVPGAGSEFADTYDDLLAKISAQTELSTWLAAVTSRMTADDRAAVTGYLATANNHIVVIPSSGDQRETFGAYPQLLGGGSITPVSSYMDDGSSAESSGSEAYGFGDWETATLKYQRAASSYAAVLQYLGTVNARLTLCGINQSLAREILVRYPQDNG